MATVLVLPADYKAQVKQVREKNRWRNHNTPGWWLDYMKVAVGTFKTLEEFIEGRPILEGESYSYCALFIGDWTGGMTYDDLEQVMDWAKQQKEEDDAKWESWFRR